MEIGIDIEENERFKSMSENKLKRIFTVKEIEYAKQFADYSSHLCAMWCVKEAVIKAFSNKAIEFVKIEIDHTENGKPFIIKNDEITSQLKRLNFSEIKISISHSKNYSTGICIIY